ncbi:RNA polymerase sigma factor [Micromonospora sp. NPDC049107]|uniref:RNA polymerase sigma factor n=1 Tax=Micromonospora sp. NPDC049107 TaxID=3154349 RepID=UPI0033C6447F
MRHGADDGDRPVRAGAGDPAPGRRGRVPLRVARVGCRTGRGRTSADGRTLEDRPPASIGHPAGIPDPADLDALARSAAQGDPAALDALLVAVRPEALRLCARFLPNRQDAEEACQDHAPGAGRRHHPVRGSLLVPYLAAPAGRQSGPLHVPQVASPLSTGGRRCSGARSGRSAADQRGRGHPPRSARRVRLGPPDHAEVVALRDVLGLSYPEIATLLDLPVGTVKSRLHLARRQVRQRLGAG